MGEGAGRQGWLNHMQPMSTGVHRKGHYCEMFSRCWVDASQGHSMLA
jgi:hypothetical protein